MNKIIDFPRAKRILDSGKFQPALHSVIGKMTYCENMGGYIGNYREFMEVRLHELGLINEFIEKFNETEQAFELISLSTGEIFARIECMTGEAGRYFLGHYAFTSEMSFSAMQVELYSWRLPNARGLYAQEKAEFEAEGVQS